MGTTMICTAHWERTGEKREAYKMDLCRECYEGQPIRREIEQGGYGPETPKERAQRRYVERHRQQYLEAMRQRYYLRRDRGRAKAQCQ